MSPCALWRFTAKIIAFISTPVNFGLSSDISRNLGMQGGNSAIHVEVRFQNLSVTAMIYLGNRSEPTVLNSYRNFFEVTAPSPACK